MVERQKEKTISFNVNLLEDKRNMMDVNQLRIFKNFFQFLSIFSFTAVMSSDDESESLWKGKYAYFWFTAYSIFLSEHLLYLYKRHGEDFKNAEEKLSRNQTDVKTSSNKKKFESHLINTIILNYPKPEDVNSKRTKNLLRDIPKGMETIVDVGVFIDKNGNPGPYRIDNGSIGVLNDVALDAVQNADYNPKIKDNKSLGGWTVVSVKFISK